MSLRIVPIMQVSHGATILIALAGTAAVMMWRLREARSPVSLRKIVIPPLGMATGFGMFFIPAFRIPWAWAGIAFLIGAVALAYPLLLTTRLIRQGDTVMMKRSSAFLVVILVLAAIRFFARGYFDTLLTAQQTAALFFVLAFGMIVRWRAKLLIDFRKITSDFPGSSAQQPPTGPFVPNP
jgi:membrane protein CcdC involved in cytochrome C biogenesis